MDIPSINKLTLQQFVRVEQIKAMPITGEEKTDKIIEYFTELTVKETDLFPEWKLKHLVDGVRDLFHSKQNFRRRKVILVKGKRYVAIKNDKDLSKADLTAIDEFLKEPLQNAHLLLAVMYRPWKVKHTIHFKGQPVNHYFASKMNPDLFEQSSNDFLEVKAKKVLGTFFFYLNRFESLRLVSQAYLTIAQIEIMEREKEIRKGLADLGLNTDGTISQIKSRAEILLKKMN